MTPVVAILGLMFLTWGVAIWATNHEEDDRTVSSHRHAKEMKEAA